MSAMNALMIVAGLGSTALLGVALLQLEY